MDQPLVRQVSPPRSIMKTNTRALIRVGPAAEYLGVHPATIRKWAMDGTLPEMILPGTRPERRFMIRDLDALRESMLRPHPVDEAKRAVQLANAARARAGFAARRVQP